MSLLTERHEPSSSAIARWAYPRFFGGTLKVTFPSGRTYAYRGVPGEVVKQMRRTEERGGSLGSFYNENIRDRYDFEPLG